MTKPQLIQRHSFFDDPADHSSFWNTSATQDSPFGEKILETTYYRKKTSKFFQSEWSSGVLIGYKEFLVFSKKAQEKSVKFIDFDEFMYTAEVIEAGVSAKASKKYPYGISISANGQSVEVFFKEKQDLDSWIAFLGRRCLLTDYEGRYVVQELIGTGGYGKVYEVINKHTMRRYAAKYIRVAQLKNKERQKIMLVNEIKIQRKLDHPLICKLYEVHEVDETIIMVMELLEGEKLFNYIIENKKLKEKETAVLMKQIFVILHYLVNKGVIHRDLKPENILFDRDEKGYMRIKLIDFGLSTFYRDRDLLKKCGTAGYVAPEILNNENYDYKVDLYSAGVLMYICLSGRPPFHAMDYQELLEKNRRGVVRFKGKVWGRYSQQARDLVSKLLEPIPACRINLNDVLGHDWLLTQLPPEEKVDLKQYTFNVAKMNVPEESKISDLPISQNLFPGIDRSRSSSHVDYPGLNSTHSGGLHVSFVGQDPSMLQTLNSFYRFMSNTSFSSERTTMNPEDTNSSIHRGAGSKTVFVNVKRPTLTIPETMTSVGHTQKHRKRASSVNNIDLSSENTQNRIGKGYTIQISKFVSSSDNEDNVPSSDGSFIEEKLDTIEPLSYHFLSRYLGSNRSKLPPKQTIKSAKNSRDSGLSKKSKGSKSFKESEVTDGSSIETHNKFSSKLGSGKVRPGSKTGTNAKYQKTTSFSLNDRDLYERMEGPKF